MGIFAQMTSFWEAREVQCNPPPFAPAVPGGPPPLRRGVATSDDYVRIKALPVRSASPAAVMDKMEAMLRLPHSTARLRQVQREALFEAGICGHGFFPIPVGGGKTLVSLLLPQLISCERPLLLLRASLVHKTDVDLRDLAKDWLVCRKLRVASYQKLGRLSGEMLLEEYRPDLIIADECQFLKNPKAACTRRVDRYVGRHSPRVVLLSGTSWGSRMRHHTHLLRWTHQAGAPVPLKNDVIDEWCQVIDEARDDEDRGALVGVLADLYPAARPEEGGVASARTQYFGRILATPGVVGGRDSADDYGGGLVIERLPVEGQNADTRRFFRQLYDDGLATDGWPLVGASEVWAVARQIALGLCYVWNPRPPEVWLEARKRWAKFARDTIAYSKHLDSELAVVNAIDRGQLKDDAGVLHTWREWKPTFVPNSEPRWHDTAALDLCAHWLRASHRGICWVEHVFFGEELSRRTGVRYFREKGRAADGTFIEEAEGPIIASVASNAAGRNLQHKWDRNLITCPRPESDWWEQLLARTHRPGQKADAVEVAVLDGCQEHATAVVRALWSAEQKKHAGQTAKLLLADVSGFGD